MGGTAIDLFAFIAASAGGANPGGTGTAPGSARPGGSAPGEPGGKSLAGQQALGQFKRLVEGLPAQADTPVQWSLQGKITSAGRRFIDVKAHGEVTLECQRCLQLFVQALRVDNRLEVVRKLSQLDNDDDLEEIERIEGSPRFEVLELIEDELILSLPSVPKHEVCPSAPGLPEPSDEPDAEVVRPSPFAVLERLKKD